MFKKHFDLIANDFLQSAFVAEECDDFELLITKPCGEKVIISADSINELDVSFNNPISVKYELIEAIDEGGESLYGVDFSKVVIADWLFMNGQSGRTILWSPDEGYCLTSESNDELCKSLLKVQKERDAQYAA